MEELANTNSFLRELLVGRGKGKADKHLMYELVLQLDYEDVPFRAQT